MNDSLRTLASKQDTGYNLHLNVAKSIACLRGYLGYSMCKLPSNLLYSSCTLEGLRQNRVLFQDNEPAIETSPEVTLHVQLRTDLLVCLPPQIGHHCIIFVTESNPSAPTFRVLNTCYVCSREE
jgi:hypothetical protein